MRLILILILRDSFVLFSFFVPFNCDILGIVVVALGARCLCLKIHLDWRRDFGINF